MREARTLLVVRGAARAWVGRALEHLPTSLYTPSEGACCCWCLNCSCACVYRTNIIIKTRATLFIAVVHSTCSSICTRVRYTFGIYVTLTVNQPTCSLDVAEMLGDSLARRAACRESLLWPRYIHAKRFFWLRVFGYGPRWSAVSGEGKGLGEGGDPSPRVRGAFPSARTACILRSALSCWAVLIAGVSA